MNEKAEECKKKAIEALENCLEELLKEFFRLKTRLIQRLDHFLKSGKDMKIGLRIEGVEVEESERYATIVDELFVCKFKKALEALKESQQEKNINSDFFCRERDIVKYIVIISTDETWIYSIKEFNEMLDVNDNIMYCISALQSFQ